MLFVNVKFKIYSFVEDTSDKISSYRFENFDKPLRNSFFLSWILYLCVLVSHENCFNIHNINGVSHVGNTTGNFLKRFFQFYGFQKQGIDNIPVKRKRKKKQTILDENTLLFIKITHLQNLAEPSSTGKRTVITTMD